MLRSDIMTERKKVRIMLPGNICYHGFILSEDEIFVIIKDKFGQEVRLNKSHIISMEVISNGN